MTNCTYVPVPSVCPRPSVNGFRVVCLCVTRKIRVKVRNGRKLSPPSSHHPGFGVVYVRKIISYLGRNRGEILFFLTLRKAPNPPLSRSRNFRALSMHSGGEPTVATGVSAVVDAAGRRQRMTSSPRAASSWHPCLVLAVLLGTYGVTQCDGK